MSKVDKQRRNGCDSQSHHTDRRGWEQCFFDINQSLGNFIPFVVLLVIFLTFACSGQHYRIWEGILGFC